MDDLDLQILDVLRRDARRPYTEIATELDVSEGTVRNRVDAMVADGVIERFTVSARTGNLKAMIELSVDVDIDTTAVSSELAEWEAVDFAWQVSGAEDIVLVVDAADTEAINALITRAREREEIVSTTTRLILDEKLG